MRRPSWSPRTALAVAALVYLALAAWMPADGFFVNDNGVKLIQTQAFAREGYGSYAIPWPGQIDDPRWQFRPLPGPFGQLIRDRLYGFYSMPFAALSSLGYRAFGYRGLQILPLASALSLLAAVAALARELGLGRRAQAWSVLLTAFASPIAFYALAFWEHVPACACVAWSVVMLLRALREPSLRRWLLCGVFGALGVYFRDELYLMLFCLGLLILWRAARRWSAAFTFSAAAIASLLPLWVVQWLEVGHPLGHRLASVAPLGNSSTPLWLAKLRGAEVLFINVHENPGLSALAATPYLILFLWRPRWRAPLLACSLALLTGLIAGQGHLAAERPAQWLLQSNGLFAVAPFLLFGLMRTTAPRWNAEPANVLAALVLLYAIVYLIVSPPSNVAGVHWGCRLLLPLYPPLVVLSVATLSAWVPRGVPARSALLAVVLLSVALQGWSLQLLHARKQFTSELNRKVSARPQSAIAAVGWFVPQELANNFYDKTIYLVREPRDLARLANHLRGQGLLEFLVVSSQGLGPLPLRDHEVLGDDVGFVRLELGVLSTAARGGS